MIEVAIIIALFIILILLYSVKNLYHIEIKRILRANAYSTGIPVGERFPKNTIRDINTKLIDIFNPKIKASLFIFTSIGCGACKSVYPFLNSLQVKYPDFLIATFIMGEKGEILNLIEEYQMKLPIIPFTREELAFFNSTFAA